MDAFEKYAAKRKLAFSLKESLILSGLIGGGLGAYRGTHDDTVASSALRGAAGLGVGALLAHPIEQKASRAPSLKKGLPLALASTIVGLAPYMIAQRLGRPKRRKYDAHGQ